jgi:hypothetical protein
MKTTRNLWPYGIIAAFVLFLSGTAGLIVIAATHPQSLVSGNYYEQEIKYQGRIDGSARAKQSGATVNFDAAARRMVISLPTAQAGHDLLGQIELYRPSAAELDLRFKLQPDAGGRQSLDLTSLPEGPWEIRVSWNAGGHDYFLDQKIVITANNSK